jgi:hypothetical protein
VFEAAAFVGLFQEYIHVLFKVLQDKFLRDDVIDNSNKPRVVLDLSDQLNDMEDDSFENGNQRGADVSKVKLEFIEQAEAEIKAPNTHETSSSSEDSPNKSRTNFAFVNSSQTLSQAIREQQLANTENTDNYVNLAISKI